MPATSVGVRAEHLAHADVDGYGAGAAVPAGVGGNARRTAAAAQPQRGQGRPVHRPALRRSVRGWTGCRPSTCSPASGSPRSTPCCSSRWSAASRRGCSSTSAACAHTPVAAPRNLARLPKHHEAEIARDADTVVADVPKRLRGWRRATRHDGRVTEISAEKGYLREFGNIVFHFSLLGLLVAVAAGKLFGYEGNVIVIADGGPGFCSASPAAFDSFRAGNTVDGTSLHPICLRVNDFDAQVPAERTGAELRRQRRLPGRRPTSTPTPGGRTGSRSTIRCGSAVTGSTCRVTATRRRSPSRSPTARPAPRPCSGVPTIR